MGKLFIVVNVDRFFLSHRKEIALAAQERGWDVSIVTANTGWKPDIEALGLKVIDLPMNRSGMNLGQELRTLLFLYRLYKKESPDVVHHVGMKAILWGTLAAKFSKTRGVVNAISGLGAFFAEDNKGIAARMIPYALRFSHKRPNLLCIFQNQEDRSYYVKNRIIDDCQSRYIKGSGVDLSFFSFVPEPADRPIKIILTARMIVEKGVFLLVEAAERLRTEFEGRVVFWLVGDLDDHPGAITKEQLETVCDGTYIQWLGYRTDVRDLVAASHIFAFPSFYMEGLPKSLIEACAIGRPIVTSNSIGCKEAVIEGRNGFLIPPKDVDALVERLRLLIEDAGLREKMGKASREMAVANFSLQEVIEKHLAIYDELLSYNK